MPQHIQNRRRNRRPAPYRVMRSCLALIATLVCMLIMPDSGAFATVISQSSTTIRTSVANGQAPESPMASRSILILHEGHRGSVWTDMVSDGMRLVLAESVEPPEIHETYLDWDRSPDEERLRLFADLLVRQFRTDPPSVILANGNKALPFALSLREQFGGTIPVVYTGVSHDTANRMTQYVRQVTGVQESLDIRGTATLMKALQPALQRVVVLHDGGERGLDVLEDASSVFHSLGVAVTGIDTGALDAEALQDALRTLPVGAAVLLGSDNRMSGVQILQPSAFAGMTAAASSVPAYSLFSYHVGNGVVGGSLLSPDLLGRRGAELALQILGGRSPENIAQEESGMFVLQVDWRALQRHHLNPSRLPEGIHIINQPGAFFRTYRVLVIILGTIFLALLSFGLLMTRSVREQRRIASTLKERERALAQTNTRLLASEEQLLRQNEDLTAQEAKIRHMAYHDALTGLPNRTMLRDLTDDAITRSRRDGISIGFYFIDADNFKLINDSFGHHVGDQLLIQVSRRLEALTAKLAELSVTRLGGDEFVLLRPLTSEGMLEDTAGGILAVFDTPFPIGDLSLYLSCSIGVVLCPDQADSFDDLLRNADTSMYHAKETGRNKFVLFDRVIHQNVMVHSQLHQQIRDAQKNGEFQVHYQPKCLPDGTVRGFEALLRWQTPSGDFISPGRFIPCAEETGVILPLGDMVLRESCRFVNRLRSEGLSDVTVSVNVSVIQLTGSGYLDRVLRILEEERTPRDAIVLEITESMLMESIDANVNRLEAMKAAGLRLSLDDFGTGYSSLTYLTMLPIEELKIDKSFIQMLDGGSVNASILSTVITLAGQLGLRTVAEGVETTAQRDFLVVHHCDLLQGFLYSGALPREDALAFARRVPAHRQDVTDMAQWGNEPFY